MGMKRLACAQKCRDMPAPKTCNWLIVWKRRFHRQLGSGVDGPLGIKNPTNGSLTIMNQSIMSAQSKQEFIYRGKHVSTPGNTATFGIMRGGTLGPNYRSEEHTSELQSPDHLV